MRLKLNFILKDFIIPLDYYRIFLSFLKKSISEINNGVYFERYFSGNARRPYTFSIGLPYPTFDKNTITLSKNEMSMIFSTGDKFTGYIFYAAFLSQKKKPFPLKNNSMQLVSVQKLKDFETDSNEILVKTLSPLCIREHTQNGDMYYSCNSDNFEEKLNDTIRHQLIFEGFSETLANTLSIVPVDLKKTVVYHYKQYCEVSIGTLSLKGDKAILNYLLKSGIGSRKSAGFGCIKLLAE
jgi:CRISPR-associated endoribonuclease Cas6